MSASRVNRRLDLDAPWDANRFMKRLAPLSVFACLLFAILCTVHADPACSYGFPAHSDSFEATGFRTPDVAFRSVPFYSLNDLLDPGEIAKQLRAFRDGGFGGSFLHSRVGLLTPYLGEDWFEAMTAGVKSSQELGIDAWFYDEDKWPSGFAGGLVPTKDPAFRARWLRRMPKNVQRREADQIVFEDSDYYYVCRVAPLGNAWFNGSSWVDLMNPDMVRAFIDCSYTPYVKRYGGQPRVRGIFTDEPQIRAKLSGDDGDCVSYSPFVASAFKKRTGRDLPPLLPALFAEVGDWRRVRLEYYRAVADAFETAFSRQIGEYCAANGLVWTGHYNAEDSPVGNHLNEGNLMQQLRHMQMPGIDALGLHYASLHCAKVMTSVANQYSRPRRLSELFGISGHNMTIEDRMWITAWHTLMGVNFMCPHLSLYSMKGERKRDYPPTISPHQPYWRYNRLFEDYSARLCYFATAGTTEAEVCVLHPIESVHIEQGSGRSAAIDTSYRSLLNALATTHRNFDLGDEQIISEIGRVEDGRFIIGAMPYRALIVPPMVTIRASTLALIERFAVQGGPVFVAGSYPECVDGVPDAAAIGRLKAVSLLVKDGDWSASLNRRVPPRFILAGASVDTVWTHLRKVRGGHTLQLSNTSRLERRTVSLRFIGDKTPVALWNPLDGRRLRLQPEADGSYVLVFAPTQTWVVGFGEFENDGRFDGTYAVPSTRKEVLRIDGPWHGVRADPNALTLDYARFSTDGGRSWSAPEPVIAIHERFARGKPYDGSLRLKYETQITDLPESCRLVVEQPEMYRSITVNGHKVSFANSGSFVCFTFRTQDISLHLRPGTNTIILELDYRSARLASANARERYGTEIESVYLIGDFAVQSQPSDKPVINTDRNRNNALVRKPVHSFKRFSIAKERKTFTGNLAAEGYPFYAGEFHLESQFALSTLESGKRYHLALPLFEAVVVGVSVNGRPCGTLFASPWEIDVTAALIPGVNLVRISFTNSLRNLMGPHHHKGGEHAAVGPATFRCDANWPNSEPGEANWFDVRKTGGARLWRDDTYCIPFGLLQPPVLLQSQD